MSLCWVQVYGHSDDQNLKTIDREKERASAEGELEKGDREKKGERWEREREEDKRDIAEAR